MSERKKLEIIVNAARTALFVAKRDLKEFDSRIENNVFDSLEVAVNRVTNVLSSQAQKDCEWSHNCGEPEYTRNFVVDGKKYRGTLVVKYSRHDKAYYYVYSSNFTYRSIGDYVPSSPPTTEFGTLADTLQFVLDLAGVD